VVFLVVELRICNSVVLEPVICPTFYTDGQIEALELFMYLPQLSLYRVDKKRGHLVLRLTTNVHKIGTKFGTSRICIILNIIYLNQLWKIKWHHIVNMTISNR